MQDGSIFIKDAPREPWLSLDLGRLLRTIHFRTQGQMLTTEVFYDPPNELPDFEKGFVGAEVVSYADFVEHNGEDGAKEAGKGRLEGKEYLTQDGDVMHFRFNV